VRQALNDKVKAELARLNKIYAPQKFKVHMVDFTGKAVPQRRRGEAKMMAMEAVAAPAAISVSNKVKMTATIVLSS